MVVSGAVIADERDCCVEHRQRHLIAVQRGGGSRERISTGGTVSVCARMFGGLGVGGLEESGSNASAESLMIACVVDRLESV